MSPGRSILVLALLVSFWTSFSIGQLQLDFQAGYPLNKEKIKEAVKLARKVGLRNIESIQTYDICQPPCQIIYIAVHQKPIIVGNRRIYRTVYLLNREWYSDIKGQKLEIVRHSDQKEDIQTYIAYSVPFRGKELVLNIEPEGIYDQAVSCFLAIEQGRYSCPSGFQELLDMIEFEKSYAFYQEGNFYKIEVSSGESSWWTVTVQLGDPIRIVDVRCAIS